MNIDRIRKAANMMREADRMLDGGSLDYYLTELSAAHDLLMARYAPFRIGDRVRLAVTPEINGRDYPSWMSWKGLLVKGARGTVHSASCGSHGFRFGVVFDEADNGEFVFCEGDLTKS